MIPGGIDAHTHMEMPFGGTFASDTFETGTRAAAWGGTTTIVDFVVQAHGQRVQDQVALWHEKADGNCAIDYGFHQIIGDVNDESLKAMDELVGEGITSFKLFMAYPGVFLSSDGQIVRAMQAAAGNGGADHDARGERLGHRRARPAGARARRDRSVLPRHHPSVADRAGGHAPRDHARRHHRRAAVRRARVGEAGARPHRRGAQRRAERVRRDLPAVPVPVAGGATSARSEQWGSFEGAKWVCSTPLRARAEGHQDELWKYIRTGDVTTVATDHCPFCMKDQKEMGIGNFAKIPNGIGSVEHRMDLISRA